MRGRIQREQSLYQPPTSPGIPHAARSAGLALAAFGGAVAAFTWGRVLADADLLAPGAARAVPLLLDVGGFALLLVSAASLRAIARRLAAALAPHALPAETRASAAESQRRVAVIEAAAPPLLWLMVGVQALALWSALAPGLLDGTATALTRGVASAVFALGLITLTLGIADLVPLRIGRYSTDGHRLLHALRTPA